MAKKDTSITSLLAALRERFGKEAFDVVDHWDADPHAIALAAPRGHRVLVYVNTYGLPEGRYYVVLERPTRDTTDRLYEADQELESADFESLVHIVAEHIGSQE